MGIGRKGAWAAMGVAIKMEGRLPTAFGIARSDLRTAAAFFASRSRRRIGNPRWHEVVVHLVDDAGSAETHKAIMDIDGATDVVTQAYDSIPPEEPGLYGELFVNVDQAFRAAPRRKGWSAAKELLLYIAHGMDHLSGADDHDERGYLAMRRRELRWMRSSANPGSSGGRRGFGSPGEGLRRRAHPLPEARERPRYPVRDGVVRELRHRAHLESLR